MSAARAIEVEPEKGFEAARAARGRLSAEIWQAPELEHLARRLFPSPVIGPPPAPSRQPRL